MFCFVVSLAKMVTLTTNIVDKKSDQYTKKCTCLEVYLEICLSFLKISYKKSALPFLSNSADCKVL